MALFSRGAHAFWTTEPGSALDWALGAVPLVAACVAGASCLAARTVLPGSTGADGVARVRALRFLLYAIVPGVVAALIATSLTVGVALTVTVQVRGEFVPPTTWGLMVVVVVMYLSGAIAGATVGTLWPGSMMPFLVTSAGVLIFFLARPLGLGGLMRVGGSTGSVADQLMRPGIIFTWCLALLWFVVPALLAVGGLAAGGVVRRLLTAASLAAICAVPLIAAAVGGSEKAYATNPSFPDRCAHRGNLEVCTRAGSTFEAEPTVRAMAPFVQAVDALGVNPRPRTWGVVTTVPSSTPPVDRAWMFADANAASTPEPEEFSQAVLMPRPCPSIEHDPRLFSTLVVATEWVQAKATRTENPALDRQQRAWLRGPDARRWTTRAAVGLGECDASGVPVPSVFGTTRSGLPW